MDRTAIQVFRVHTLSAQLLFERTNEGALEVDAAAIQRLLVHQAAAIGIDAEGANAQAVVEYVCSETEFRYPDLFWIAALAQAATTRLLYRETSFEDSEPTEIMALELTALLSARKGEIPDAQFLKWHRNMFGKEIRLREVLSRLELLVTERSGTKRSGMHELTDSVDVTIPLIPGVIRVDAKKAMRAVKKLLRGDA